MSFSESEAGFAGLDHSINSEVLEEVEEEGDEEEDFIELPRQPKSLTEYLRKGARVAADKDQIIDIEETFWYDSPDKAPVQLRSLSERITVFLKLLGSDTPGICAMLTDSPSDVHLQNEYLLWVVAYRWVVRMLHSRREESDGVSRQRLREQEKWTHAESEAFFNSLSLISEDGNEFPLPPVTDRGVQLTAQLLAAFEAVQWLAQALLLMAPSGRQVHEDRPLVLGEAEKIFSGRLFHARLTEQRKEPSGLSCQLWTVANEGLLHMLAKPKGKKVKRVKENIPVTSKGSLKNKAFTAAAGRFSALADLDIM